MTAPTRYWLSIGDGASYGPYSVAELEQFRRDGLLIAGSMLCVDGSSQWASAESVLGFAALGSSPPAAPPPPAHVLQPPPEAEIDPRRKSRAAAALLGMSLGWLGAHNFYLGFVWKGLAQVLISAICCPFAVLGGCLGLGVLASAIWGFIEGVLILTGSVATDASGVPLRE